MPKSAFPSEDCNQCYVAPGPDNSEDAISLPVPLCSLPGTENYRYCEEQDHASGSNIREDSIMRREMVDHDGFTDRKYQGSIVSTITNNPFHFDGSAFSGSTLRLSEVSISARKAYIAQPESNYYLHHDSASRHQSRCPDHTDHPENHCLEEYEKVLRT